MNLLSKHNHESGNSTKRFFESSSSNEDIFEVDIGPANIDTHSDGKGVTHLIIATRPVVIYTKKLTGAAEAA